LLYVIIKAVEFLWLEFEKKLRSIRDCSHRSTGASDAGFRCERCELFFTFSKKHYYLSRKQTTVVLVLFFWARVQPTQDQCAEAFCDRPIALTQEERSLVDDVCECVHDCSVRMG